MLKVYDIDIKGLVQGVGFRPYVYRLAKELNLTGFVDNRTSGVRIEIKASDNQKDEFLRRLKAEKPDVAVIHDIHISEKENHTQYSTFFIAASKDNPGGITRVSPDIAVCKACLKDLTRQPHRINYPFINCTHCGPRFSIVESIPYDRPATTMRSFEMCEQCKSEYENPEDRRFHAQPVACNHCGPSYRAFINNSWTTNYNEIIQAASRCLKNGGIIALKGIGGFNWITDATNDDSIYKLRQLKHRNHKPFAIMANDTEWIQKHLYLNAAEKQELESWRRAIVLLNEKEKISAQINGKLNTLGVMLPYQPVHYDLLRSTDIPAFIFTSANRLGEPMLKENEKAREYLISKSGLYIEHNRPVHNRVDDSVIRIINNRTQILRRARGYTPEPVIHNESVEGGLAFGAEMTSVFALGKGNDILLSQYIGNLNDFEAFEAYKETISRFSLLFRAKPAWLVADMHPEYYSTRYAEEQSAAMNLPLYKVQHHHAHAVSVMVEHQLSGDYLALCLDGTGLGDDGESWGGELLRCSYTEYKRIFHLPYVPLPGGDKASKECWRMAISYLHTIYPDTLKHLPDSFIQRIGKEKITPLIRLIESPLSKHLTSSMGRLFDAVSSITGICDNNSYQAEAAMRLEHLASESETREHYSVGDDNTGILKFLFDGILNDLRNDTPKADIARKFHNTIVCFLTEKILQAAQSEELTEVILSGGVFQNKLLSELLINSLEKQDLTVYYPTQVPCNDGGIAVGQLAIAAAWQNKNKLL
ncbi:MAG: carbamoyltransferase HypF [Bacteroidales bacterium]